MRTMKQLRDIVADIMKIIKEKDLTLEETFYVLNMIRFLGMYMKIKADVMKGIEKLGA